MLPSTADRVSLNTSCEVNAKIRKRTLANVSEFAGASAEDIEDRLHELDHEWDIERAIEANASSVALIGLGLGALVDRRFFVLPGIVAGFLFQHAVQGWCPPVPILRRMGFRTQSEIERERSTLKALRGDFEFEGKTSVIPAHVKNVLNPTRPRSFKLDTRNCRENVNTDRLSAHAEEWTWLLKVGTGQPFQRRTELT